MKEEADVMVIVAHPDDAEFGIAGSVARWHAEGKSTVYVVCTNGDKGTTDRRMSPASLAQMRKEEQQDAARTLGVREVIFLGLPDQALEDTPAFREDIVRLIRQYRPHTVASTDPYRRYVSHRDHRIIGQVVMDAAFPYARDHMAYPQMLIDGLEPHKIRQLLFFGAEDVNYHVDITATFDQKLAALRCHASQVRELQVDNLEAWLRDHCEKMAEGTSYRLAEAFHRVRMPA